MKDVYQSKDQNFESRIDKFKSNFIFLVPVLLLVIVILSYSVIHHEGPRRRGTYQQLAEGLSYMDTTGITVASLLCVALTVGLYLVTKSYYKERQVIIGVKFNDKDKELTVTTKTAGGQVNEGRFKYARLKFQRDRLSDGMTPPMYDTFTLSHNDISIGHLYSNHFTWDTTAYYEIVNRIKNS